MTQNLPLFFALISASSTLFLGMLIFFHSRKSATSLIFSSQAVIGTALAVAHYFSVTASDVLLWIRLVMFLAVPHVFLFYIFVVNFPNEKLVISKKRLIFLGILMGVLMVFALSPWVFSHTVGLDQKAIPVPGPLMFVFSPILVFVFLFTFFITLRKYFKSEAEARGQWLAISMGLIISYLLLIFFILVKVVVWGDRAFVAYLPLFLIPIFFGSTYAILRHHLFNIEVIATEIFSFLLTLACLVLVLISETTVAAILSGTVGVAVLIFSILLIRSVFMEVRQREELQKLTQEMKDTNAKLTELSTFKSQLLSLASHQIKSPLAVIKGFTDILLEGLYGPMTDKVKSTVLKIRHSTDDLIALINTLLDLRRVDEGKMEFQFMRINLLMLASGLVEQLKPLAAAKSLEMKFSGDECMVKADEQKLRQVIQNLVDNAIKYTPSGSINVTITDKGTTVVFAVEDSGLGIAPTLLPHLFEEFVRDDRVKKQIRGTGLGLYIAKRIVEAHGGRIWGESAGEGKGSRFLVELPKYQDPTPIPAAPISKPEEAVAKK